MDKQLIVTINLTEEGSFSYEYEGDTIPLFVVVMQAYTSSYVDSFFIINQGGIRVNGCVVTNPTYQVLQSDVVYMGNKQVRWEEL